MRPTSQVLHGYSIFREKCHWPTVIELFELVLNSLQCFRVTMSLTHAFWFLFLSVRQIAGEFCEKGVEPQLQITSYRSASGEDQVFWRAVAFSNDLGKLSVVSSMLHSNMILETRAALEPVLTYGQMFLREYN